MSSGAGTKHFTPAERIAELNDIDKSVGLLLNSASQAIQILANSPSSTTPPSLESQKSAFTMHAADYFSTLSSIEVKLRRQVYALEEAELLAPGEERDAKRGRAFGGEDTTRIAGGGPLDASWLNARASDSVGKGMERELWAQARLLIERLQNQEGSQGGRDGIRDPPELSNMDVDTSEV